MVGNAAPIARELCARVTRPRLGDLVVETGAHRGNADTRLKALGILLEHRDEWWETDAEWGALKSDDDQLEERDRRVDNAWYVQYGNDPADICRWTNCEFTAVLWLVDDREMGFDDEI